MSQHEELQKAQLKTNAEAAAAVFTEKERSLNEFVEENRHVLDELRQRATEFNQALDEAGKAARAYGETVGPFKKLRNNTKVDGQKLVDIVGLAAFLRANGQVSTDTTYKISDQDLRTMVAQKVLTKDQYDEVASVSGVYSIPKPLVVP